MASYIGVNRERKDNKLNEKSLVKNENVKINMFKKK